MPGLAEAGYADILDAGHVSLLVMEAAGLAAVLFVVLVVDMVDWV